MFLPHYKTIYLLPALEISFIMMVVDQVILKKISPRNFNTKNLHISFEEHKKNSNKRNFVDMLDISSYILQYPYEYLIYYRSLLVNEEQRKQTVKKYAPPKKNLVTRRNKESIIPFRFKNSYKMYDTGTRIWPEHDTQHIKDTYAHLIGRLPSLDFYMDIYYEKGLDNPYHKAVAFSAMQNFYDYLTAIKNFELTFPALFYQTLEFYEIPPFRRNLILNPKFEEQRQILDQYFKKAKDSVTDFGKYEFALTHVRKDGTRYGRERSAKYYNRLRSKIIKHEYLMHNIKTYRENNPGKFGE